MKKKEVPLPTHAEESGGEVHDPFATDSERNRRSNWAVEYEADQNKRQKKIRISIWCVVAFLAFLAFLIIMTLLLGPEGFINLLREFLPKR
jgi:hypothetical protein